MATPSPPFSEKDAAPAELEYVDTSHEEANIGTEKPLQNTLTAQTTTNEVISVPGVLYHMKNSS